MLSVKDYQEKVYQTFSLLEKYGINVYAHTIIINLNKGVKNIVDLWNFIKKFKNVVEWRIDEANYSMYLSKVVNDIFLSD
ncbi:hypothetical protein MNBD_BACTEROID01-1383 [hydrothermal vent metagenome]|uniref:Uncharacterized protein n=1 Tax=hydrothermal vent metagenome TaxID=652676 RepID=A0A3B0U0Q2_9ZZZZ